MAEQLDVRLVLEARQVEDAGRVCDLLSEHGVRTVQQFSALTEERLLEWGIDDSDVYDEALEDAQSLTHELSTSPHTLSIIKQQLLDHALYWALFHNDVVRAQELLSNHANINYHHEPHNGFTPLHASSYYNGDTEAVAMLLQDSRLDVNACDKDGWTPLHWSAYSGHKDICNLLLNAKGINVNAISNDGDTALHRASHWGTLDVAKALLTCRETSLSLRNKWGRTPLDEARKYNKHDVVEYLQQQLDSKSQSATTATATLPSTDAMDSFSQNPDPADSSESSAPVDPSDAMDSLGLNVTMSITNLGAQGYPGTGKTSLLDLAMGKDPAESRNSTGCIDPPSRYLVVKGVSAEGVKWDHVTSDRMFDMVCDAVKETIDNPPEQTEMPRSSTDKPTLAVPSKPEIPLIPDIDIPQVERRPGVLVMPNTPPAFPEFVPSKSSWFLDLLKKTKESKGSGIIFDSSWLMVTDSGGQPPFLDASALFLRNCSLQIFSLKLDEPLDHRPEFSYFIDGKSASFSKSNLKLSNQQIIETMAKSVSAIQPAFTPSAIESPDGAKFAIVGTFEDQAHLCSETIEDKESTLDEALKPYKDFQVRYDDNLILPVNAVTTAKEERKRLATKLRKLIVDASGVTMKVVVKLRWFGFLLSMLTKSDKENRSVLTLEECQELGKFLEMEESEVLKAIRFFHDINLIMHYNTPSLRNSVIVDAKPLLDKVSLLLSASFVDKNFLSNHCGLVLPTGAKDLLQQHGRFSPKTLENFIKFEEPITKKFFLDVLVEVKAVAAIDESSEYIMPCTLTYLPDEQCEPHPSTPWVIRFRIKCGVEEKFIPLPVGYLPGLVVFLLTCFSSLFSLNLKDHQFRNLFVLKYKQGGKVYIVERHLQLEIYFTFCEKLAGDCIVIRESIQMAISLTEKRLCIEEDAITKVDSFLCFCSDRAHHVCIYNHETGIAECEDTDEECVLEAQHLRWIKSDAATASTSSSQPSSTTQTGEKTSSHVAGERPKYPMEQIDDMSTSFGPLLPSDAIQRKKIKKFAAKQVKVIIQSCNNAEYYAALERMKPAKALMPMFEPVKYPTSSYTIVVGTFAGRNAAIVRTRQGNKCRDDLEKILRFFPHAKYLLGLGVCMGIKGKFGDVLIGKMVQIEENLKLENGKLVLRGTRWDATQTMTNTFCDDTTGWKGFECTATAEGSTSKPRTSQVFPGCILSSSALVNDKDIKQGLEKESQTLIGAEMEGWVLFTAFKDIKSIIIKGISDYGDGTKAKDWQLTAAKAAVDYAHFKLEGSSLD